MSNHVILCVDDEQVVLKSLESQLVHEFGSQFHIELSEGGPEALELLDELSDEGYKTLVIISDWLMPEMKGDDFLIKAYKRFPHVLTLMLTGQADNEAIEKTKSYANLYKLINKPWDASELIESIKTGLRELGNL
ncbi:response regulator [Desulfovibrio inopinatus]|uniref:response regulator n=1 Tax=Desulfovibrio inopinatus TaxID=102109 RepID=UPI000402548E|nr:response regulator [Desulfovibrio inopinatus]